MVYSSWGSPRKDNFVVNWGVWALLLVLVFIFLCNRSSEVSPVFSDPDQISASIVSSVDSQKNTDQIPSQEYGTGVIENGGKCDLFTGDWVPYPEEPLYNKSCNFISIGNQNCLKSGRPDTGYLYWRWKPHGCDLPRFDPVRFLELMRNKSWAFVGDSISRNQVQSFLCILSKVVAVVQVYHDEKYKCQKWLIPSYNFTASVIWSPFLAKAYIPENLDSVSAPEIELHLDVLDDTWTEQYKSWDYIILSCGKWFSRSVICYENNSILGCHYCPKSNLTELSIDFPYRKVVKNVYDYIITSNHKAAIFYRTTTPDHFEGGEWNRGGSCKRKAPAKEGELELRWLDKTLRAIEVEEFEKASVRASENGVDLRLLDVNPMSLLRPDAHPDVYRFDQDKVLSDCLHWCLPGPVDTWNDLLMEMIL